MLAFASPPLHFSPLLSLSIFLVRPSFRIWRGPEGKIFIRSRRPVLVSQVASPVCLVQAKITRLRDSFIGFSSSFVPGWYGIGTEPKTLGSDHLDTRTGSPHSLLPFCPLSLLLRRVGKRQTRTSRTSIAREGKRARGNRHLELASAISILIRNAAKMELRTDGSCRTIDLQVNLPPSMMWFYLLKRWMETWRVFHPHGRGHSHSPQPRCTRLRFVTHSFRGPFRRGCGGGRCHLVDAAQTSASSPTTLLACSIEWSRVT